MSQRGDGRENQMLQCYAGTTDCLADAQVPVVSHEKGFVGVPYLEKWQKANVLPGRCPLSRSVMS